MLSIWEWAGLYFEETISCSSALFKFLFPFARCSSAWSTSCPAGGGSRSTITSRAATRMRKWRHEASPTDAQQNGRRDSTKHTVLCCYNIWTNTWSKIWNEKNLVMFKIDTSASLQTARVLRGYITNSFIYFQTLRLTCREDNVETRVLPAYTREHVSLFFVFGNSINLQTSFFWFTMIENKPKFIDGLVGWHKVLVALISSILSKSHCRIVCRISSMRSYS